MHPLHREAHLNERIGWLRAAVLGANDGIISTSSLLVGIAAAASTSTNEVIVTGVAGLVAGATAMAAGEYVSVSSQADTEAADLTKERVKLVEQPDAELHELTNYVQRGLNLLFARGTNWVFQRTLLPDRSKRCMTCGLRYPKPRQRWPISGVILFSSTHMMTEHEMTDAEVADQIVPTASSSNCVTRSPQAAVDPASLCADAQRRGLQRIAFDAGRGAVP